MQELAITHVEPLAPPLSVLGLPADPLFPPCRTVGGAGVRNLRAYGDRRRLRHVRGARPHLQGASGAPNHIGRIPTAVGPSTRGGCWRDRSTAGVTAVLPGEVRLGELRLAELRLGVALRLSVVGGREGTGC